MDVNEARRLSELEQENRRLKTALAEVTLREGWQINRKRVYRGKLESVLICY